MGNVIFCALSGVFSRFFSVYLRKAGKLPQNNNLADATLVKKGSINIFIRW